MSIAYIASSAASNSIDSTGTALTINLPVAAGSGDLIVGMVGWQPGGTLSVVDTGGSNTVVLNSDQVHDGTHNQDSQTFYIKCTGFTDQIQAQWTSDTGLRRMVLALYSGTATTPFDKSQGNLQASPGTGTDAVTSGSIATAETLELIVGFHQNTTESGSGTGSITAGTGFTQRLASGAILAIEDQIFTAGGSIAATHTISNDHETIAHIVAFKDPSGVAAGSKPMFRGQA